jgi:hypothetical protein
VEVESIYENDLGIPGDRRGGLLVKNWSFTPAGTAPAAVAPFTHWSTEIADVAGVPGQGNSNPPGAFLNHFIVVYAGQYWDPSYGAGPFANQTAWEDASLEGFSAYKMYTDPGTGLPVVGLFAKRNTVGAGAVPIGLAVDGANRNDFKMMQATLQSIPVKRPKPTRNRPQGLCLDKGYDYDEVRELAQEFWYTAHIRARGEEAQAIKHQAGFKSRR